MDQTENKENMEADEQHGVWEQLSFEFSDWD